MSPEVHKPKHCRRCCLSSPLPWLLVCVMLQRHFQAIKRWPLQNSTPCHGGSAALDSLSRLVVLLCPMQCQASYALFCRTIFFLRFAVKGQVVRSLRNSQSDSAMRQHLLRQGSKKGSGLPDNVDYVFPSRTLPVTPNRGTSPWWILAFYHLQKQVCWVNALSPKSFLQFAGELFLLSHLGCLIQSFKVIRMIVALKGAMAEEATTGWTGWKLNHRRSSDAIAAQAANLVLLERVNELEAKMVGLQDMTYYTLEGWVHTGIEGKATVEDLCR